MLRPWASVNCFPLPFRHSYESPLHPADPTYPSIGMNHPDLRSPSIYLRHTPACLRPQTQECRPYPSISMDHPHLRSPIDIHAPCCSMPLIPDPACLARAYNDGDIALQISLPWTVHAWKDKRVFLYSPPTIDCLRHVRSCMAWSCGMNRGPNPFMRALR